MELSEKHLCDVFRIFFSPIDRIWDIF